MKFPVSKAPAKRFATLLLSLAATMPALANIEWTGGSSQAVKYWDDADNWDAGTTEPHRFNYAEMKGASADVVFTNSVTLSGGIWIENNLSGLVTFKADSLDCGLVQAEGRDNNINIGTKTWGAVAIEGGTYHFANDIVVGNGTWDENARGDFTLHSGRVETHFWVVLGVGSKANAQGNVTIENGELVVGCRDGATGGNALIEMGRAAASVTTFTQTGGSVSSESNGGAGNPAMNVASAENTTATYTISGGSYTARAGNVLIANGAGSNGTLNINGGTFTTEAIVKGSGTATINLNGGTLVATTDGTFIGSGITLNVGENGGYINPNGHNIVIDTDITGTGWLTIVGNGTVMVNGYVELPNGALTFNPDAASQNIISAYYDYTLKLVAQSVLAQGLYGGATIETANGVVASGGKFYGRITGQGSFTANGNVVLQGANTMTGGVNIESGQSLTVGNRLADMTNILYAFDASDASTFTTNSSGNITKFQGRGSVAYSSTTNAATYVTGDASHFGGKPYLQFNNSRYSNGKNWSQSSILVTRPDGNTGWPIFWNKASSDSLGYDAGYWRLRCNGANYNDFLFQNGTRDRAWTTGKDTIVSAVRNVIFNSNRGDTIGAEYVGAIAELVGFSSKISLEDRAACEMHLMHKWNLAAASNFQVFPSSVGITMADGATLDLGGQTVAVSSFEGAGVVRNGSLVTSDKKYTQGEGDLTIPAVNGATYVASKANYALEISNAAGKNVKVRIPNGWLNPDANKYYYITCAGNVTFEFEGETLEYTPMGDGRYRFGSRTSEYDFGEYGENTTDNANEEARDDAEAGLAFPGAYGWGRFAKGARASSSPTVYHVTNLNDSGTGSLRDAVSKPNRIVVFDVSGVIKISSRITFASNLYVAGQTAPGEGITVYGNGCSFSGSNNIICRYLRWRMGHGGSSGKDCAGLANGHDMIFDHCSFSWGLDETCSINPDGKGTYPQNITLQNCIFGQGLMTHSAGGLMQANYITLYRNLYVDNSTRNNKVKGINQYVNNIVYNWKNGCYIMGGDSSGSSYCTIVGNLFINGPVSGNADALGGGNSDFHFFGNDNWQDKNKNGVLDASLVTHNGGGNSVDLSYIEGKIGTVPTLPMYGGDTLLDNNLRKVGASLPYRDQSDCYMIDEVRTVGTSGALITYEDTLAIGAPDTWEWWGGTARADNDKDGMPDEWEAAHGLNPKDAADAVTKTLDGTRLNIEIYINSISADDRQFFLRSPVTLKAAATTTHSIKLSWRDYTYGEIGFSVEKQLDDGSWQQVGIAGPNETSYTIVGLNPGTYYNLRVLAVGRDGDQLAYSDPAAITVNTRAEETGEVDIDSYEADFTVRENQVYWDKKGRYWVENKIYSNEDDGTANVLFNTDGEQTITITTNVAPAAIVANGTGYMKLQRFGWLTGTTSINKGNTGTLALVGVSGKKDSLATYTGKVVNHEGTIEFDSIANGGVASALGKSTKDATNWVFDGGTYKYTGGSASTDRSATFRKASTLNIANSGTTLTMSGAMEGTGDFILDGAGTLAIADANTFFGSKSRNAIIKGGTLCLSTTGDSGSARNFANGNTVKSLTLAGGRVVFNSANEEYQTYSIPMYVEDGTESQLTLATHSYMKSRLIGNGDITFNISYVRAYISSNMDDFTGNITANGTASGASFFHNSYWNYPRTRFNLTGTIGMSSKTRHAKCHLGGLSGAKGTELRGSDTKSAGSNTTWYIGYANSDEDFAGEINDWNSDKKAKGTTSVVKVGTGIWRLSGTSSHSGTTTVNEGTLVVNGTLPATSAVIVNAGATLKGEGTIKGAITVNSGGTIQAGDEVITNGVFNLNGALTLKEGSRVVVPLKRLDSGGITQSRMKFNSGSSMTIEDGATLEFDLSEVGALKAGDTFQVFANYSGRTGEFSAIEPSTPGRGLLWDTSLLYDAREKRVSVVADTNYVPDMNPDVGDMSAAVAAVSEFDAYNALDVAAPASSGVDNETYKSYFKYAYTDNGNGTFKVEIVGVDDEVVSETVENALDALVNGTVDGEGYISLPVKPGLYYGIASGTSPDIPAPTRYKAGETTWKVAMPQDGNAKFIRIDVSPSPQNVEDK